jgi:plastocyanin
MTRRCLLLPGLAALLVVLSGCGGGYGDSAGDNRAAAATTATGAEQADESHLTISAGDLFFKPKEATAPAGRIEVTYVNDGQIEHTLLIEGKKDLNLKVEKGGEDKGSVELQPGDYTFYCDVPGHRSAGMELKVHVQ